MKAKISLISQIAAVEAAAEGRSFSARSGAERLHNDHLQAALATLKWVKTCEDELRAFNRLHTPDFVGTVGDNGW
jgi:hypothetical protein